MMPICFLKGWQKISRMRKKLGIWCRMQYCSTAMPTKAGIRLLQSLPDPGFRRGDGGRRFCSSPLVLEKGGMRLLDAFNRLPNIIPRVPRFGVLDLLRAQ
jgi:hypothetical protein